MPSNPYKPQMIMRKAINNVLMVELKNVESLDFDDLVLNILLKHPVSEQMVISFIKKYYVDSGLIKLIDGVIYK